MRREFIRHDNLRKHFEMFTFEDIDYDVEIIKKIVEEIKHSKLILAGEKINGSIKFMGTDIEGEDFGVLFTDMDEFRKYFPNYETEAFIL